MSKPSLGNAGSNWANSDLPVWEKLRLVAKNSAIKAKNRSHCCGNHGEPGC